MLRSLKKLTKSPKNAIIKGIYVFYGGNKNGEFSIAKK